MDCSTRAGTVSRAFLPARRNLFPTALPESDYPIVFFQTRAAASYVCPLSPIENNLRTSRLTLVDEKSLLTITLKCKFYCLLFDGRRKICVTAHIYRMWIDGVTFFHRYGSWILLIKDTVRLEQSFVEKISIKNMTHMLVQ